MQTINAEKTIMVGAIDEKGSAYVDLL